MAESKYDQLAKTITIGSAYGLSIQFEEEKKGRKKRKELNSSLEDKDYQYTAAIMNSL